jgi:hypothetical protein
MRALGLADFVLVPVPQVGKKIVKKNWPNILHVSWQCHARLDSLGLSTSAAHVQNLP